MIQTLPLPYYQEQTFKKSQDIDSISISEQAENTAVILINLAESQTGLSRSKAVTAQMRNSGFKLKVD